jgi:imidazolonepropionase-like amidohydrolase
MLTLTNARVFDGSRVLPGRLSVNIEGEQILSVVPAAKDTPPPPASIDVGGMTVMPGLITCHLHPDFYRFTLAQGLAGEPLGKEFPPGVMMAIAIRTCRVLLESGFTGYVGASCSNDIDPQLKIAIAEGIMPGPRIRACSHHIGTTADHNDSRKWWRRQQQPGTDLFADGPDALRRMVRAEIGKGAETIKIFASSGHGGVPTAVTRNMSRDEMAVIVTTAHERGVKVRAHVVEYSLIQECLELGVDIIDHGDDIDERIIDRMAKAGTFWVPSLTYPRLLLELGWAEGDGPGVIQRRYDNVRKMLPLAQKAGVRILVGDDYSGVFREIIKDDPLDHQVGCYGREFPYYGAIEGLKPEEVLGWGTRNAGQLLLDPPGRVGIIEPGALADLIVVDGNPVEDLSLLAKPAEKLRAVIRNGTVVIDRLSATRVA